MASPYFIDTAQLHWPEQQTPQSTQFDDIYFSKADGLAETDYVFLQHNALAERWQQLDRHQAGVFVIAETGFGTGLNFLAAAALWQRLAPPTWRLVFFSVEKFPLRRDDLTRALSHWPTLSALANTLTDAYPPLIPGLHCIDIPGTAITLQLWLGDAIEGFEQWRCSDHPAFAHSGHRVDAWFLDGFAPAKNPDLWCDDLFALMSDLSGTGTRFATFTSAGVVRRGLQQAGFSVRKVPGFGSKREMLCGEWASRAQPAAANRIDQTPWYVNTHAPRPDTIAIIGGGLAGIITAHALARRGRAVTVIERAPALATGASGNPQGMLYTKLSPQRGALHHFTLSAFMHALRFYRQRIASGDLTTDTVRFCGLAQLAYSNSLRELLPQLRDAFAHVPELIDFNTAAELTALTGVPVDHPGWLFPTAGWAQPLRICQQLAGHPLITCAFNSNVTALEHNGEHWLIQHNNDVTNADTVVIATSHDAAQLAQTAALPLKAIRGQITQFPASAATAPLTSVLCHEGYLTPAIDGMHSLGATFDNFDTNTDLRESDHRRNLNSLADAIPALRAALPAQTSTLPGRAALRCASPDYLPLVGPVPDHAAFISRFADLRKNARHTIDQPGVWLPGLYVNVAHGSRGLTSIPLCAELIASMLCNEPAPLPRSLTTALNPARFIVRDLGRNRL